MIRSRIFYLSIFLLLPFLVLGGHETYYSKRLCGSDIGIANLVKVSDTRYPNSAQNAYIVSSKGIVTFEFDHGSPMIWREEEYSVDVIVNYRDRSAVLHTKSYTLTISNLNNLKVIDKDIVELDEVYDLSVSMSVPRKKGKTDNAAVETTLPSNICLRAEIQLERYYQFNAATVPVINPGSYNAATDELQLTWNYIDGAEDFELEYTWVDDYVVTGLDKTAAPNTLSYDFRNNATRVITKNQFYKIPVIYDRGYLLYRVRAVGRGGTDYKYKQYGNWSSTNFPVTCGTVQNCVGAFTDQFRVSDKQVKNWQFLSSFAEEGKRKDVVTHFDGSLRNRQVLTKSNSNNKLIVGEGIYDYQGRLAIQVLPVPIPDNVQDQSLNYHTNINLNPGGASYNKNDFDSGDCETVTNSMSNSSGASQYYSSNNPEQTNENAYIPDAGGYPFTQVEYEPDNTGRIRRQSGVGADHKLGSGHETKYFYGQPEQEELDRLLGSSAGYASHYKKNLVIDANKQISVSYLDQEGRVVATALTGKSPDQVVALTKPDGTSIAPADITITQIEKCPDDVPGCNTNNKFIDRSIVFSKELLVSSEGAYTFNYEVTPAELQTQCTDGQACYDCIYDLEITITDACGDYARDADGNQILPRKATIGTLPSPNNDADPAWVDCSSSEVAIEPIACNLPVGNYTVTKRLTISENAFEAYWDHHVKYCIKTAQEFIDDEVDNTVIANNCAELDCKACLASLYYNPANSWEANYQDYLANTSINTSDKLTFEDYQDAVGECEEVCDFISNCEASYRMMLTDVSPGGQYAVADATSNHWALSLFNGNNFLPRNRTAQSQTPTFREPLEPYVDGKGNIEYVPVRVLVANSMQPSDYEPAVYFPAPSPYYQPQVLERVRWDDDHYVADPEGDTYAVRPQYLYEHKDFREHWKESWAKSLVQYHPEYCYYESCLSTESTDADLHYSSNDFDARLQLLETYKDATEAQTNTDNNPLYDARFTTAMISGSALDYKELLDKDPWFKDPSRAALKQEMDTKLKQYQFFEGQWINVKEYAAVVARCGNVYYLDNNLLTDCKSFGAPGETQEAVALRDQEWQNYSSYYLSEKQKLQQRDADLHCMTRSSYPGYNGCISDDNYNPFNPKFRYPSAGVTQWGVLIANQPCGIFTYQMYANKERRFVREENVTEGSNFCEATDLATTIARMKEKADLEHYLETGQCALDAELNGLLNELASKGNLYTNASLRNMGSFTKSLYDFTAFGTSAPPANPVYQNYTWTVSTTDEYNKLYKISTNASVNLHVVPGQNYNYIDANGKAYQIPLSFATAPAITNVPDGRFEVYIEGIRNLLYTGKVDQSNDTRFLAQGIVRIVDKLNPAAPVVERYYDLELSGTTTFLLGTCDYSTVCELKEEANDIERLLSAIAAKKDLNQENILLTDWDTKEGEPNYYDPIFSPLLRAYCRLTSDYVFKSVSAGNSIAINIARQVSPQEPDMSINLTFTENIPDMSRLLFFTCIRNNDATDQINDFFIYAAYDPGNSDGKLVYYQASGIVNQLTYTAKGNGILIPVPVSHCGPPRPLGCRSEGRENTEHIPAFLSELVTLNGRMGNATLVNGTNISLYSNKTFQAYLNHQLGNKDFFWKVQEDGKDMNASICVVGEDDICNNVCDFHLSFVNRPVGIGFKDIVDFGILRPDYSQREGTATNHFTIQAVYFGDDNNNGKAEDGEYRTTILNGYSCFPVEYCEETCMSGWENLVRNGAFQDPTIPVEGVDVGYQTDYHLALFNTMAPGEGRVAKNAAEVHPSFWSGIERSGDSYFLIIDGKQNKRAWYTKVPVVQGETYRFTVWGMEVSNPEYSAAQLALYAGAIPEGQNMDDYTGYLTTVTMEHQRWKKMEAVFTAQTTGTIEIGVVPYKPTQTDNNGDDFAVDDISFSRICRPDFPVYPVAEEPEISPCVEHLTEMATLNGQLKYERYLLEERESFRRAYFENCSKPVEKLNYKYKDKEHHYTLYYYDQAGSLVKTVPPEGVDVLTPEEYQVIKQDRWYNRFQLDKQPAHSYVTTYSYNSLSQLTTQSVPDHEYMQIFESNSSAAGIPSNLEVMSVQFKDATNGFIVANDPSGNSHVFVTSNGGANWSEISQVGTTNLEDVQFVSPSVVYAVGKDGVLLRSTGTAATIGQQWVSKAVASSGPLVALSFKDDQEGWVFEEDGTMWKTQNAGDSWTRYTGLALTGKLQNAFINYTSGEGYAVSNDGSRGYIYYTSNSGLTWSEEKQIKASVLSDVEVTGTSTITVAGKGGLILQTNNGGTSWNQTGTTLSEDIKEIHFADATKGCAVLQSGRLVKTTDGGKTWNSISLALMQEFNDLHFTTPTEGFASDKQKKVYKTTDGGQSWTGPFSVPSFDEILTVDFKSGGGTGMAAGKNGAVYKTEDGGNNWTAIKGIGMPRPLPSGDVTAIHVKDINTACALIASGTASGKIYNYVYNTVNKTNDWTVASGAANVVAFDFISSDEGFALTSTGTVLYTSDGGLQWTAQTNNPAVTGLTAIDFTGVDLGYVTGQGGKIFRLNDGDGLPDNASGSWVDQSSVIVPQPLNDVILTTTGAAYAAGNKGTLLKKANATSAWEIQSAPVKYDLQTVDETGSEAIAAAGTESTVIKTTNGTDWLVQNPSGTSSFTINDMDYEGTKGSAVGASGKIINSVDDGAHWSDRDGASTYDLQGVDFVDENTGIAVGANGTIVKSSDGGSHWTHMTNMQPLKLNASHLVPGTSIAYGVGANGMIVKSTDGGHSWKALNSPTTQQLFGVFFTNAATGLVAGTGGTIYRTADGGATWQNLSQGSATFKDIYLSGSKGFIVGSGGTILQTNSAAYDNWSALASPVSSQLNAVFMVDAATAYAAGNGGAMLKWTASTGWSAMVKTDQSNWTSNNLNDIYFEDAFTGYAVGDGGVLLKTITKGQTWSSEASGTASGTNLNAIAFTSYGNAVLGGTGSTVNKLKDQRDQISSRFWYDELGRLVASQNSKQFKFAPKPGYSYTRYDALGRISEVGEVLHSIPLETKVVGSQVQTAAFESWLSHASAEKREITRTYYDAPVVSISGFTQQRLRKRVSTITYQDKEGDCYDFATHYSYDIHGNVYRLVQENNHLWAGSVTSAGVAGCAMKTSKDPAFENNLVNPRFKTVDYTYDLVSGNVHEVKFQGGRADQFIHRYHYDADNRITEVFTSSDGATWEKDAKYFYYNHGPLARTEIGNDIVQGMDFAYTIQGWIKGVNSNTLVATRDQGKDGSITANGTASGLAQLHSHIPSDEMGFTLGYFEGDYKAIGSQGAAPVITAANQFEAGKSSSEYKNAIQNLYNGNISHMVTAIGKLMGTDGPMATSYSYDQLNRLKSVRAFQDNQVVATNQFAASGTATMKYSEDFEYDGNGNITKAYRNGDAKSFSNDGKGMDNLQYVYEKIGSGNTYVRNTNKLRQVIDLVSNSDAAGDLESGQLGNNYSYDAIGNLISDVQEEISDIEWTSSGKVRKVTRKAGSIKEDLEFAYDATGNRIMKIVKPRPGGNPSTEDKWLFTYYVRDASGNVMSTYHKEYTGSGTFTEALRLEETSLYGSARVGVKTRYDAIASRTFNAGWNSTSKAFENLTGVSIPKIEVLNNEHTAHGLGLRLYELSNHLGNVLLVVSDKKTGNDIAGGDGIIDKYSADVVSGQNYYAFGMVQPGQRLVSSTGYRFGFNGKEKDGEWNSGGAMYDYGFRIYDPRIAKFLSVDPLTAKYPWYTPYQFAGNIPIKFIDLDGLEPAEKGQENNEYRVANRQGTNQEYGYTWTVDQKGNGSWVEGNILNYKNGSTSRSEAENVPRTKSEGDLKGGDNPRKENATILNLCMYSDNHELEANMYMGIFGGTLFTDNATGNRLYNHFKTGGGGDLIFSHGSVLSNEVGGDQRFLTFAREFEDKALAYFKANKTIVGFNGNEALMKRPSFRGMTTNLFLATTIGGTQGVKAQIRVINSKEIDVNYTFYDVFGAGKEDANSYKYPGLQSMYVLQHYRNVTPSTKTLYQPFILGISINRIRTPR